MKRQFSGISWENRIDWSITNIAGLWWGVGSGQWGVGSGEWGVASGQWRVANDGFYSKNPTAVGHYSGPLQWQNEKPVIIYFNQEFCYLVPRALDPLIKAAFFCFAA